MTSAPLPPRHVFISASAIAKAWRAFKADSDADALKAFLQPALFFFGSKRSWLFPKNDAERDEAKQQGRYEPPWFPEALTELIRAKANPNP
jgi:hypothetical protein